MRLQAISPPDPADSGVQNCSLGSPAEDRTFRCVVQCEFDLRHLRIRYRTLTAGRVLVGETLDAVPLEPALPPTERVLVDREALGDFLALRAVRAQQHPAPSSNVRGVLCRRIWTLKKSRPSPGISTALLTNAPMITLL